MTVVHALTGSTVVACGAMALVLSKGSAKHKIAGRCFTVSTLAMGPVITAQAWLTPGSMSSLGIVFVFFMGYLVVSAWSTIGRPESRITPADYLVPLVALGISIACLALGLDAINNPIDGGSLPPKEAYFFFAVLAFTSMLLDINNIRAGGVRGKHRVIRHSWRMSCALFFATSSFFTGPGSVIFPESVRGHSLLSIPQILVVLITLFWIHRLLFSGQRT